MKQKLRVVLNKHQRPRLGQPAAGGKDRLRPPLRRRQRRVFPQGRLGHRKALRVDVLQHRKKQQLLGGKEFIERPLGDPHGVRQLLHGGLPHPDGHTALPRLPDQVPDDHFILFFRKSHSACSLTL